MKKVTIWPVNARPIKRNVTEVRLIAPDNRGGPVITQGSVLFVNPAVIEAFLVEPGR